MKSQGVRERVLETASRLFYKQGYNLTGINQIIEEAAVAKASFYHHFPSKGDLLTAYLESTEYTFFQDLDAVLQPLATPEEKLWALFDFRLNRQTRLNFGGCTFIKITNEVPRENEGVFAISAHKKNRFKGYLLAVLTELQPKSKSGLSIEELADTFFLLIEGATAMSTIYKDQSQIETAKKVAQKLL